MTNKAPMTNVQGSRATVWSLVLGHLLVIGAWSLVIAQPIAPLYQSDFQQSEPPALPDDFKALSGEFAVRQEGTNRFLELSATPLNSFGIMVGPERAADTSITARLRGWTTGKRFPEMGIGLGGAGGFRLWLMPAVQELQIRQGDKIVARSPFTWTPTTWFHLHLQIHQLGEGRWQISGKAWPEGAAEPADWIIRHEATNAPPTGRAVLWGTPYSEKPIHFDDVRITAR